MPLLASQVVGPTTAERGASTLHRAELGGPVPPWCLQRLCDALADAQVREQLCLQPALSYLCFTCTEVSMAD